MGSSTRNKYGRGNRLINEGISNGTIGSNCTGIGDLLKDLMYPERGLSKPRSFLQSKLYSTECVVSIKKLIKLSKIVQSGSYSQLGIGGSISSYSRGEISELVCQYIGLEDEVLKTSFKESISNVDILNKETNIFAIMSEYIKNVISNVFKIFTCEDAIDTIEDFTSEGYENNVSLYMNEEVLPLVNLEIRPDLEDVDDEKYTNNIIGAFTNVLNRLRRVGE